MRANLARLAAISRRRFVTALAGTASDARPLSAVVIAALAQSATLAFVSFNEHPNGPLLGSILSQVQLF